MERKKEKGLLALLLLFLRMKGGTGYALLLVFLVTFVYILPNTLLRDWLWFGSSEEAKGVLEVGEEEDGGVVARRKAPGPVRRSTVELVAAAREILDALRGTFSTGGRGADGSLRSVLNPGSTSVQDNVAVQGEGSEDAEAIAKAYAAELAGAAGAGRGSGASAQDGVGRTGWPIGGIGPAGLLLRDVDGLGTVGAARYDLAGRGPAGGTVGASGLGAVGAAFPGSGLFSDSLSAAGLWAAFGLADGLSSIKGGAVFPKARAGRASAFEKSRIRTSRAEFGEELLFPSQKNPYYQVAEAAAMSSRAACKKMIRDPMPYSEAGQTIPHVVICDDAYGRSCRPPVRGPSEPGEPAPNELPDCLVPIEPASVDLGAVYTGEPPGGSLLVTDGDVGNPPQVPDDTSQIQTLLDRANTMERQAQRCLDAQRQYGDAQRQGMEKIQNTADEMEAAGCKSLGSGLGFFDGLLCFLGISTSKCNLIKKCKALGKKMRNYCWELTPLSEKIAQECQRPTSQINCSQL